MSASWSASIKMAVMDVGAEVYEMSDFRSISEMVQDRATVDKAQYTTPTPTQLSCQVESRRRCVRNSQLVVDSLDESEQICQKRSRVASCRQYERRTHPSAVVTQFTSPVPLSY